ncbi:hypothetical protein [Acinetobacter rudis]|uniref:Phage replication protein P n=1 Tax=Acinetobacter rudis TaxID=632955 RepID=A0AAW8JB27_9GAMM|nr:hypothetical protein [Acinetobacter rudis]MDQ8937039.1 hypothetical protein [Acinetobacter rudis]MDQ9019244.1 hypothetical protein [Acinetobacter rudis]
MNTMVSSYENNVKPISAPQLTGVLKAIVPRSFEKTFDGIGTEQIASAIRICIEGLTRDQVNSGLEQVRDNGFCPDPAMFRKWCLGIVGFGTEQQRAIDSFKGKHAALANIVKWVSDDNSLITNAEKEAYNRCYEMFSAVQWASNQERATYLAYEAFKDNYIDVVKEFVEQNIDQAPWVKPKAVDAPKVKLVAEPSKFSLEQSPEDKLWIQNRTKDLQTSGLSFPSAMMQATKELQSKGGAA